VPGQLSLLALQAFIRTVRARSEPVCTVEHGHDAVLTCLLVRAAVDSQTVAMMERFTS
jgi:hypothetical protein